MKTAKPTKSLDKIDRNILNTLQNNGRISFTDLGQEVGLSTSPCLERVKKLEQEGYIRGYQAILNPALLGADLLVYVEVALNYTTPDIFKEFREHIGRFDQIQECHLVSGDFDYLLKIRIDDMSHYRKLLEDILHQLPGVRDTKSYIVMEEIKESAKINLSLR